MHFGFRGLDVFRSIQCIFAKARLKAPKKSASELRKLITVYSRIETRDNLILQFNRRRNADCGLEWVNVTP